MSRSVRHPSSRVFPTFIGISLVLIGSLFVWLMARSALRALEIRRHWTEVPCVILSSAVEERIHDPQSSPEYRLALIYGYEWKGDALTGDRLTLRGNPWSSDRKRIEKQLSSYPVSSRVICRVNPAHPTISVLQPDSLAPGYSLWFPALFVVGGAGMVVSAWRKRTNV